MPAQDDPRHDPDVTDPSSFSFADILDRSVLDELRTLQEEGEPDIVTELIDLYLQEAPARLDAIRAAVSHRDASELVRAAHSLKGSSANLGAGPVSTVCGELERCGRENQVDETPALLQRLEDAFGHLRSALQSERVES